MRRRTGFRAAGAALWFGWRGRTTEQKLASSSDELGRDCRENPVAAPAATVWVRAWLSIPMTYCAPGFVETVA
ncbi:hypothetical protein GCM10025876_30480 [Demequina litorisediminis]|uniref:Secreted protein n=1 Tax=Demequina litorisediminis TaxID=1849022 RepID=A0ABQ6IGH0_9MICO|nr:hypothetical protein GCM10025876_30480 [Demequina litorisediminis]